jgi:hypothetical protein
VGKQKGLARKKECRKTRPLESGRYEEKSKKAA